MKEHSLTKGSIFRSLLTFAVPVFLALFLQAMYGAADLIIVGQFAGTGDQSGVASGSQLFNTATMLVVGLTMGVILRVCSPVHGGRGKGEGRPGRGHQHCALCSGGHCGHRDHGARQSGAHPPGPCTPGGLRPHPGLYPGVRHRHGVHRFLQCIGSHFPGIGGFQNASVHRGGGLPVQHRRGPVPGPDWGWGPKGAAIATVSAQALSVLISPLWSSGSGACPLLFLFPMCVFSKTALCPS